MEKFFNFKELNTNFRQEFLGALSAFATMAYILILIPKIMESGGFDYGASLTALACMAFFSSFLMGVIAKVPFASAPYLGESAFISVVMCTTMGYKPPEVLGIIFICGVILFILSIFNIRSKLVNSIPKTLKYCFTIGLGMFLFYLGAEAIDLIKIRNNIVVINNILNPHTLIALFGVFLIFILSVKKIKSAILIGIITTTIIGILTRNIDLPTSFISSPPSLKPLLFSIDLRAALSLKFLPAIFIMIIIMFADTMGTTIALASKAELIDKDGNFPNIKKVMITDSLSTMVSSLVGTITTGAYAESAAGIEAGAKSGFAPVIVGILFLLSLFFAPIISIIPPYVYGSALIAIGLSMISFIKEIDFNDYSEYVPSLFAILLMVLSKNLGIGMAFAFIVYPILKLAKFGVKTLNISSIFLFIMSILFFIFYPY